MKTMKTKLITILVALSMVLVLAACGSKTTTSDAQGGQTVVTEVSEESTPKTTNTDLFTDRDLDPSYTDATTIDLSKKSASTVTISEAGTYILTGTYNGRVVVNVGDQDKVQLVLDNVTIANNDGAAIYVQAGDKVFVTLKDGTTNKISSGATFSAADAETGDNIDAAIWSKATLTFNGSGKLTVSCDNGHGIVSKDDLKVTGGTITVNAGKKALAGKDSVRIHDGVLNLTAGDDAIHTSNDEDETKGFVYIEGGTLTIDSGDDGIHAETDLTIVGGVINITKSYEGLEGQDIAISGGKIDIVASDDGINASEGGSGTDNTADFGGFGQGGGFAEHQNATLTISGGTLHVNAGGDGLDSNGSMTVSGGTTYVSGPTNGGNGSIDCDNASITGGTVIAAGSAGMAMNFGSNSTQCSMLVSFDSAVSGGTEVTLKDSSGNTLLSYTPEKDYQTVVLSSADIKTGETYTVTAGSQSQTIEMTETLYGSGGMMGGGMQGGGMQGQGGQGGRVGRGGFDMERAQGGNAPNAQSSATVDSQSSATM